MVDSHVELFKAHQDISDSTGGSGKACQDKSKRKLKEKKAKTSKEKKRSKAKAERETSPTDLPIHANKPMYYLCNQVSCGEMIGCDNDECPIEWFHFSCVGLNHKPKDKWHYPKCRGENEKTMNKALEKSKKEWAYNRLRPPQLPTWWWYVMLRLALGGRHLNSTSFKIVYNPRTFTKSITQCNVQLGDISAYSGGNPQSQWLSDPHMQVAVNLP
ncbi:hypothetical protein STEG23_034547 [Scotinomys teguina]